MNDSLPKVYLVGAGPGNPGLLTLRGFELLKEAQIIFYDNLVNPEILKFASPSAELVDVGKRGEGNSADQEKIEDQIVRAAKSGKITVRLKGGDPFVFGRGGEEAERLAEEAISFEVVPGVSSPVAVPAYAGIPLTHRDFTSTIAFVTGHLKSSLSSSIDWNALSKMETIVFLMGVKTIRQNMQRLIEAGCDPKTPAALIRWGTYPQQQTWVSTIEQMGAIVESQKIMPPCILVVGKVVTLRERIKWFEKKPLFGKKIIVTRARAQASLLLQKLSDLGAETVEVPAIEIRPPSSFETLDQALYQIQNYDWIFFTSANAVRFFFSRFKTLKIDLRLLSACKIAAVGPETAKALNQFSLRADRMGHTFDGSSLADAFSENEIAGKRILFPRAKKGGEELIEQSKQKGAFIDCITVYENHPPRNLDQVLQHLKSIPHIDLITFASSSSVKNFCDATPEKARFLRIPAVCIGPSTLSTARKLGFENTLMADQATLDSLIAKILDYFKTPIPPGENHAPY